MVSHPIICWALYGSEEAGKIIEEPFGITGDWAPSSFWSRSSFLAQKKEERSSSPRQESVQGAQSSENLPLLRYCEQIKRDIEEIATIWATLDVAQPEPHGRYNRHPPQAAPVEGGDGPGREAPRPNAAELDPDLGWMMDASDAQRSEGC